MNLKSISDSELLVKTKALAHEERRIGLEVLHHLREIDTRKLFASLSYSSLFDYCTMELGYSGGGAYRRISVMRLLRDVPEYETKLQDGAVSVATLSQVQSFIVQEKRQNGKTYTLDEKLELLSKVEGKSSQQTERVLAEISPQAARIEKERVLNSEETEIRFTASRKLMEKIERLKNLLGHQSQAQTYAGLIEELADIAIKRLDPAEKITKIKFRDRDKLEVGSVSAITGASMSASTPASVSTPALPPMEVKKDGSRVSLPPVEVGNEKRSRYIPASIRHAVWVRDQGRCTFVSSEGRRCDSKHALEIEHIRPFAKGGESTLSNLKLLCPAHNQLSAIQAYGLSQMQKYWRG
jgi:hypothetical protein